MAIILWSKWAKSAHPLTFIRRLSIPKQIGILQFWFEKV